MSEATPIGGPPSPPMFKTSAADASRVITVFVLLVVILYFGREVLVPITLALFLSFILAPVVTLLRKLRLGRIPAVLLAVVLALVLLGGIGGVIGSQVADLATNLPQYASQIKTKLNAVERSTIGQVSHVLNRIGRQGAAPATSAPHAANLVHGQPHGPAPSPRQQEAAESQAQGQAPAVAAAPAPAAAPASPRELIMQYLGPVLSPFATFGIVIIVTIFALLQREDLRDRLIRLVGSDDIHRTTLAMDDAGRRLSRYFLTQLAVNAFFGLVIGVGLFFIGVPKPVLWGVLSTVLRFVPYVGSFISALLPTALAAAVHPGWSMAIWTACFFVGAEGITGQAVEPLLYGHSTGLSPFSVVVAAIFWSWVWGPVGLILSTPLTLCLVVMGRHVQSLEFLEVMLGDRAALTPVESFYQRILADDPDEALSQAELFLKQEALFTYYDKVVLKAMQMAAFDAERGVLIPAQVKTVVKTIEILVGNLEERAEESPPPPPPDPRPEAQPDADTAEATKDSAPIPAPALPPPAELEIPLAWQHPNAVLSIAGRGPLDAAAASMLQQLMTQRKFGCRTASHAEVERETIRALDVTGVQIACLAYLDVATSRAQLRYLVRRLRVALPAGTPIVIGLWPQEDEELQDAAVRQNIGADYYASSFESVLETCRALAQRQTPAETPALLTKEAAE